MAQQHQQNNTEQQKHTSIYMHTYNCYVKMLSDSYSMKNDALSKNGKKRVPNEDVC